jgi:hypothetical protein
MVPLLTLTTTTSLSSTADSHSNVPPLFNSMSSALVDAVQKAKDHAIRESTRIIEPQGSKAEDRKSRRMAGMMESAPSTQRKGRRKEAGGCKRSEICSWGLAEPEL